MVEVPLAGSGNDGPEVSQQCDGEEGPTASQGPDLAPGCGGPLSPAQKMVLTFLCLAATTPSTNRCCDLRLDMAAVRCWVGGGQQTDVGRYLGTYLLLERSTDNGPQLRIRMSSYTYPPCCIGSL